MASESKEKVAIIGTSQSAIGIFEVLKKNNCEIFVIGNDSKDYLVKLVKKENHINYNYSKDIKEISAELNRIKIRYIIPSANDASYRMGLLLANKNKEISGYDEYEVGQALTHKDKFAKACQRLDLKIPKTFTGSNDELLELENPGFNKFLLKPTSSNTGQGIIKFDKWTKLINYLENVERTNWVLQDYVEGQLFSCSAFIKNHKISDSIYVDEYIKENEYWVKESIYPSEISEDLLIDSKRELEKLAAGLKLVDGLIHGQFIAVDNKIYLIEVMRRMLGDFYGFHFSDGELYHHKYCQGYVPILGEISKNIDCRKSRVKRNVFCVEDIGVTKEVKTGHKNYLKVFNLIDEDKKPVGFNRKIKVVFIKIKSRA